MLCEYYNHFVKEAETDAGIREIFDRIEKARMRARKEMPTIDKEHVLFSIRHYNQDGEIESVQIHRNAFLTDDELDALIMMHPDSFFDVLHGDTCKKACIELEERAKTREIRPINLKEANHFINKHHRHHAGTVGCKFVIGLFECNKMIGAAICGRPVSRYLDNGEICEINRLCTVGDFNACSQLYGACAKIAKAMGYKKIITYILKSENGASLRASNFTCEGEAGGTHWTGSRNRGQHIPSEMKTRWSKLLV